MSITDTTTSAIPAGAIYSSGWGYDQTNVDFYEVVSSTAKTVTLRPLAKRVTELAGFMSERVEPIPGQYTGPAFRRKNHGAGAYVSIDAVSAASVWNGSPELQSHYD